MSVVAVIGSKEFAKSTARTHLRDFDLVTVEGFDVSGNPALSDARVIVICADTIGDRELTVTREVVRRFPLAQVLLVTKLTGRTVRLLSEISWDHRNLVGINEAATTLRARVYALLDEHYLDWAVGRIAELPQLSPVAKLFVKRGWRQSPPPTSVAQVSREIGIRSSTLRDNWPFDAPPKALVDWALLGRAVTERQHGVSWARAAARVGVTQRRLKQIALRRLGCSLKGLDKKDEEWA